MPDPLVIFSPLPPAKSGIADYMLELLPALGEWRPVFVVCETPPEAQPTGDWQVLNLDGYRNNPALHKFPHIYQIGNNADHVFAYRAFRERPGILVQHDFNLHYLVEDVTLVQGDVRGYRNIMREEYGEAGATLADLRQTGLFSEAQKLALPLNTHLLHQAQGLIVHSHWVFNRLPEHIRPRTLVIPHHYAPQADAFADLPQAVARARLDLPADGFVLLSLGYITPPKQIHTTLAALALLRQRGAQFTFVIGGQRNPGFDIDAHIRQHGLEDCVRVTGYLDEDSFFTYIAAADALCNLRYPSVGESSGTLARALAMGLPSVVHNFGPFSEFPDDVVLKVPLELGEPAVLASVLDSLMNNPGLRMSLSERAHAHMRAQCSVERSALHYSAFADRIHQQRAGSAPAASSAVASAH